MDATLDPRIWLISYNYNDNRKLFYFQKQLNTITGEKLVHIRFEWKLGGRVRATHHLFKSDIGYTNITTKYILKIKP